MLDIFYLTHIHINYMPDNILNALSILSYLILIATLGEMYYFK